MKLLFLLLLIPSIAMADDCVCHYLTDRDPVAVCMSADRVASHLAHGDTLGDCSNDLRSFVPPGCWKIDTDGTLRSYTALESGWHTFKGGSEASTNGYLITVYLLVGETWTVPTDLASISHYIVCPDEGATTTTTLDEQTTTTTSTTTTTCPDVPIVKDPISLRWRDGRLKMHGSIVPPIGTPIYGFGLTLATPEDGIFLGTGCVLSQADAKRWRCADDDTEVLVKVKPGGRLAVFLKAYPDFFDPSSKYITTRLSLTCHGGEDTREWNGEIGRKIRAEW